MPSFLFTDTGSFFPPNVGTIAPATGSTVRLGRGYHAIAGAATLAALTVMMPANPYTGSRVVLYPGVAVTTLTMQTATGGAIAGAPAAAVAGKPITMLWNGTAWITEVD